MVGRCNQRRRFAGDSPDPLRQSDTRNRWRRIGQSTRLIGEPWFGDATGSSRRQRRVRVRVGAGEDDDFGGWNHRRRVHGVCRCGGGGELSGGTSSGDGASGVGSNGGGAGTTTTVVSGAVPPAPTTTIGSAPPGSTTTTTTTTAPPPPLTAPSGLTVISGCQALILVPVATLKWTASPTTRVTGYVVLRSTTKTVYNPVGSVSGRTTVAFTDTTVSGLSSTYWFEVKAVAGGSSAASGPVSTTTPPLCL